MMRGVHGFRGAPTLVYVPLIFSFRPVPPNRSFHQMAGCCELVRDTPDGSALLARLVSHREMFSVWLEELSLWVYVVLVGGWLLQRWARKMKHPQSKLDRVHARWPSFSCDELEELIAAHRGDAEAAGATIQQHILSGKYPLVELEMTKEDVSTRLGCLLSGQPSHLPSVSGITPGSLAAASLRIGDLICRINGEPALGVQEAQRLLMDASGAVRVQVHRRQALSLKKWKTLVLK